MRKTGICFKEWLRLAESVDANMGEWIKVLVHYAKPEERRILDSLVGSGLLRTVEGKAGEYELQQNYDAIVKAVLKEKRKENMNWLAFALGYLSVKAFRREDLEMAVDQLERMKSSGEVTRAEIGSLGWMRLGASMQDRIADYKRRSSQLSKTQSRKMAKRGEISPDDAHLIKHVASEGDMDLYYLPSVSKAEDVDGRQRLLCKYGRDTQWCTAAPGGTYHNYYSGVGIFILHSGGRPKYQFVDCGDVPERHEEDDEEEESIAQFMDVNDQKVTSLSPKEQKFLSRQANISCYDLAPDGFEDMAEFDSSSDERVRASSGSVAAKVLSMAGNRVGEVAARLGPALSRMSKSEVYWLTKSDSWNSAFADSILDVLGGSLRDIVGKEERNDSGLRPLMVAAISSSTDPASKIRPIAGLIEAKDMEEIFKNKPKDGDGILKSILGAKKQLKEREAEKIVSLASDVKGMLVAMGGEVVKLFSGNPPAIQTSKLWSREDGSRDDLSRFIEDNLADLPPNAVYWAIFSSSDKESTAKRMLSAGLDDERIKILFGIPEIAHLADDSHIRRITKSRNKRGGDLGLAALANKHGKSEGDERLKNVIRFLNNSDDLEGHEVMAAVTRANQKGQSDRLVELMPQEIIDLISLDDMKKSADEAEESCLPSWASPNSKEREGCDKGRPLVAVMKKTRLNFPMDYLRFMKKGRERDELIADKIKGSDWKGSMTAMDLADDKDFMADRVLKERGEKVTPGEIASILANSKDKGRFIKKIGDKINLLSSKYERPHENFISSLEENDDWMDWLTATGGASETIGELLKIYKKPLGVRSIYNIASSSDNPREIVRSMSGVIRGMDVESYGRLKKMSLKDRTGSKDELTALLDDARHGDLGEGDIVVAEKHPWAYATTVPDEKQNRFVGKRVDIPMNGNDGKMRYKVVGLDGDDIMISITEPVQTRAEGEYRFVDVTPEWVFKSARKYFARPSTTHG